MSKNNTENLRKKLESAKKNIRNKDYDQALQLLKEINKKERESADKKFIESEARSLLKELVEKKETRKLRLLILGVFAGTLLFIVLLESLPVFSTEVEIRLNVSQFSFGLSKKWDGFSLAAETIGISHLDNLTIEVLRVEQATAFHPESGHPAAWQKIDVGEQLKVQKTEDTWGLTIESEYLTLSSLMVAKGADITILRDDSVPNQISIRISNASLVGYVDTGDTLILTCNNCSIGGSRPTNATLTQSYRIVPFVNQIEFKDLKKTVEIAIELPRSDTPALLGKTIAINSIHFTKSVGDDKESTLERDGVIYFAELDNKQFKVREGDFLVMDNLKEFQIRKLELENNLNLTLQGKLGEMKSGTKSFLSSRMPSWLLWLYMNQSMGLIVVSIAPLFSAIIFVFYRLRISDEFSTVV